MNWYETFRAAGEAVRAHRMRSILTMLGIVIGIASVILTVGFGQGAQNQVKDEISALGSNLLIIAPGSSTDSGGLRGGFGSAQTLSTEDAAAIGDDSVVPDAAKVAATTSSSVSLTAGEDNWTTSARRHHHVVARRPHPRAHGGPVLHRRRGRAGRRRGRARPGHRERALRPRQPDRPDRVGRGPPADRDRRARLQRRVLVRCLRGRPGRRPDRHREVADRLDVHLGLDIYVEAASADTLSAAYQEIDNLLLTRHGVSATDADFTISTQDSLVETANSTNETLTVLLTGIAAISLLVGGVGVMNIMLVSVTERIREIGLRKALGATPTVIGRQFLVEASMLGLAGGLIGVLIGVVGAWVLPPLIDQPVTLSVLATVGAIATSLALGVGFGVYPASRAARLTPIDALRSE